MSAASGLVSKLNWSAKRAHSIAGVWHSATDGNFVGGLATTIGNVVEDIDVDYSFSGGSGDVDIVTSKFNVEVKSGLKMKLTQYLKKPRLCKNTGEGVYSLHARRTFSTS
jgi:hypothetical protein